MATPDSTSALSDPISPRRKRTRVDLDVDESQVLKELQAEPERDEAYYFADGSCIIRVENTLFNVHRTIVSRDSSIFSEMFALPTSSAEGVEGKSDDSPIVIQDTSASEFKNLLWALYALPHELMVVHSDKADVTRLIDIALLSNKFQFGSLETWALDAIAEYVNRGYSPIFDPPPYESASPSAGASITPTGRQIIRLARLAYTCHHSLLLDIIVDILEKRMRSSIQYAYLAMSLADELDLRRLRGLAYMEVLQKEAVFPPQIMGDQGTAQEAGDIDDPNDADAGINTVTGDTNKGHWPLISPQQQLRLLAGFYRLSRAWEDLRRHPLQFEHAATCAATWHQHGCTQSWIDFWKEKTRCDAVLQCALPDVPGRLHAIGKEFDRWGTAVYMHHDCRATAKRKIVERAKAVEDELPEYFAV
ncbi:hypothetical protein WOLCODRAFT_117028 [Wolfiporia cocos MD-104 SS10]|uniref:BTB domain-containing protein n=1 Tax=Wolfiporia cocos (strain MD-104) TaxID=742152 RepID=A0A2H3JEI5_WOLCO|nr:hypothetical protein WOLCODRAFT_117028 [Wolfiporia cocos MD-104 SS10]